MIVNYDTIDTINLSYISSMVRVFRTKDYILSHHNSCSNIKEIMELEIQLAQLYVV